MGKWWRAKQAPLPGLPSALELQANVPPHSWPLRLIAGHSAWYGNDTRCCWLLASCKSSGAYEVKWISYQVRTTSDNSWSVAISGGARSRGRGRRGSDGLCQLPASMQADGKSDEKSNEERKRAQHKSTIALKDDWGWGSDEIKGRQVLVCVCVAARFRDAVCHNVVITSPDDDEITSEWLNLISAHLLQVYLLCVFALMYRVT